MTVSRGTLDGFKLGEWASLQRQRHIEGTLDADRQRRLKDLPGWTWDPQADKWEKGFSRLLDYVDRNGHARVPSSYTVDGFRLGQWVVVQRYSRSKGTLSPDRVHRLQELDGWTWDARAARWEEGFNRLLDYVKRHGNARVPVSYIVDGCKLGGVGQHAKRLPRQRHP